MWFVCCRKVVGGLRCYLGRCNVGGGHHSSENTMGNLIDWVRRSWAALKCVPCLCVSEFHFQLVVEALAPGFFVYDTIIYLF